jgi:hypothetical protein
MFWMGFGLWSLVLGFQDQKPKTKDHQALTITNVITGFAPVCF